MIHFYNEEIEFPRIKKSNIKKWIKAVIEENQKKISEVSIIFCSDKYILKINREYLNHDYFTDIITFNYNKENLVAGDIFISIETVTRNSKDYNVSAENELKRVIIHGVLHLLQYDDSNQEQKIIMRKMEDKALSLYQQLFP